MTGDGLSRQNKVKSYATLSVFPTIGSQGVIYIDLATGILYTWNGSAYVSVLSTEDFWDRTGDQITPKNAGDDLDMGTGDVTATTVGATSVATTGLATTTATIGTSTELSESSGDTLFENTSATNDFIHKLGDAAGATEHKTVDSADATLHSIKSDGEIQVGKTNVDGVVNIRDASAVIKVKWNPVGNSYVNGGNTAFGDTIPTAKVDIKGDIVLRPSTDQTMVAGTGITGAMILANPLIRVVGNGGDITITATPSIAAGVDGQRLLIQGTDNTDTVTLQDESNLAGSDLNLAGGVDFTLGRGDTIEVIYDSGDAKWFEITRSDNTYTA
jgi:hypothetical protein